MVIVGMLLLVAGAVVVLYRYLGTRRDARGLWRSSIAIGFGVGVFRAVLACIGWYGVAHTSGPLQIPAYVLAMLAWPEAALFGHHRGPVPGDFYVSLAILLIGTSVLFVSLVGVAAQASRRPPEA
jgi:hypothetical protein